MKAKEIYLKALKENYALCAFNFSSLDILKSIVRGAEKLNSPVILAVSEGALNFIGENFIKAIIKETKKSTLVPVIFHLDHGKSYKVCKQAVKLGFDSIMIDASDKSFEENIKETKKVCDYCHKHDIWVEAELGSLFGIEDNVNIEKEKAVYTDPIKAKEFVEKTKVDSLAIAIGTSHGAYKFKGTPALKFDILEKIEKQLPHFPLVLHGASSISKENVDIINQNGGNIKNAKGITIALLEKAIKKHNIIKINMDSDLRIAFTAGVRKSLTTDPANFDTRKYFKEGQSLVQKEVENKILKLTIKN